MNFDQIVTMPVSGYFSRYEKWNFVRCHGNEKEHRGYKSIIKATADAVKNLIDTITSDNTN